MTATKNVKNTAKKAPRGERTRQKIKQVIASFAKKKEIADFTLADICKKAEITTGAFYFHFGSKEDAIDEMVTDEFENLYTQMKKTLSDLSLEDLITELIEISTRYHQKNGILPRALQLTLNSSSHVHEAWIEKRRPLVDHMEQLITKARVDRGLDPDPSRYLAYYMLNAVEDIGMDAFQWNNPTLAKFTSDLEEWKRKQASLWSWAVLAPI